MIFVADSLPDAAPSNFNVAIIGAGAVGVALATRLAGRVGRIALIEAGGPRFDWRVQAKFFKEDRINHPSHPTIELGRRRMLGGTTSVWGGRCIPLDPEDYEKSAIGPGWPISQSDVAPWIKDSLEFLQAGNPDFLTTALPASAKLASMEEIRDPDLRLDCIERFSKPTNVWRQCGQALVESDDVVVLRGAACTNILTTSNAGCVVGIELRTDSGRRLELDAATVVLACGGLETPRLLLASRDHRSCGLGNEHDLVGRYYMTHLAGTAGSLQLREVKSSPAFDYALDRDGIYIRRLILLSPQARRRAELGNIVFRPHIHPIADPSHRDPVLSAMMVAKRFISPEYSRKLLFGTGRLGSPATVFARHSLNIVRGIPRLASFGIDWLRRRVLVTRKLPGIFLLRSDASYPLAFDAEQSPEFDSRVSLGADVDPNGVPRLAVHWRMSDSDLAWIARAFGVLATAAHRAGLGQVELEQDFVDYLRDVTGPTGGHHIGTARMGSDPGASVVDANGELWHTKGLYVAGSAVFPSCGFANPTLTAVALAFRMAEHLEHKMSREVVVETKS